MIDLEQLLRDEFAERPPLRLSAPSVLAGVARRQRQRAIAAIVAAAVVGATVIGISFQMLDRRTALHAPIGPEPSTSTPDLNSSTPEPTASVDSGPSIGASGGPAPTWQSMMADHTVVDAVFVDSARGYVLLANCTGSRNARSCRTGLAVTSDGGRTWVHRPVAGFDRGVADPRLPEYGRVLALGGDTVLVERRFQPAGGRWVTGDAGRTWIAVADKPTGTVDSVPSGGYVVFPAPDVYYGVPSGAAEPSPMLRDVRAQVLTPDGRLSWLRDGPSGEGFVDSPVTVAADGSIWVQGNFTTQDQPMVSRDRGRTWTTVTTPNTGFATPILTGDGRQLYRAVITDIYQVSRVVRSDDAGASWAGIPVPSGGAYYMQNIVAALGNRGLGVSVAALADGGFMVCDAGQVYRLRAGGSAFTKVIGGSAMAAIIPAGRAVLGLDRTYQRYRLWTEQDGWRPLGPF